MPPATSPGALRQPLIIGHRGAPGYRPEHTESSYRLACELGADAVEPDVVATRDGVLVIRHENEISGTTDVAQRPEFASRKTTKRVDGVKLSGWFTEDFTWDELRTLRSRERLTKIRAGNREFDGREGILRLCDVLRIVDEESEKHRRDIGVVVEIKHAHYFSQLGLPLDQLVHAELEACGWGARPERLILEAFELGVLDRLRDMETQGTLIFLIEREGAPADEIAMLGSKAHPFAWYRTDRGLETLVDRVHGISVAKSDLLVTDGRGKALRHNDLVARAHARGLQVYVWTLRPERLFLNPRFGGTMRPAEWGDWQREFEMIFESGVDGVFVDHPDLAVQLRDAR